MIRTIGRRRAMAAVIAAFTSGLLLLTGCAGSSGGSGSGAGSGAPTGAGGSGNDTPAGGTPVKGGNLVVRIAQDPGSLDSVFSDNVGTSYISNMIFEQLYADDANFQPQPVLAKSYTKSKDGLTYTFTLRSGVVFSDGNPMTAADVVASLKYWVEHNDFAASLKGVLKSISSPSPDTVVVRVKSPFNVLALMAAANGSQIREASAIKSASKKGIAKNKIVGTGPYKLKSWTPGQEIVIERNDKYQPPAGKASGWAGPQIAYLDTITYKIVADQDAVLNGLKTGLFDVAEPANTQYDSVKSSSNLKIGIEGGGEIDYIGLNHNSGSIFSKAKARDALNMLIDKSAIAAAQGVPDLIQPSNGAFAAVTDKAMYSDKGKAKWELHDPQQAKKLFEEAGLKPGQTIRMITTGEFPQFKDALVIIQDELKKIGIKSSVKAYDFATLLAQKNDHPDGWDVLALMEGDNPPVPSYTGNVWALDNSGYPRDKLQPLIDAYNAATTPEAQHAAIDKIQEFTAENLPTITLYDAKSYIAYNSKLHGYAGWSYNFGNAWLAK